MAHRDLGDFFYKIGDLQVWLCALAAVIVICPMLCRLQCLPFEQT